ncbi:MAG: Uma2 family endonuclease [Deltaproteobacteria bacterium]|nr:Uma2 family endonuclease [Deltaproteobacteria bacterium]
MGDAARKQATYDDVLNAPPNMVAELIHGVLHLHPRPASRHTRSASKLGATLDGPFDAGRGGPGGWIILDEPELHLGRQVLVPDLAGWRRERMPELPDAPFFEVPPNWACEVLAPSTAALDRGEKMPLYTAHGVTHLWLIDPLTETLEIYRVDGATYRAVATHSKNAVVRAEPFDAIELALADLWAR